MTDRTRDASDHRDGAVDVGSFWKERDNRFHRVVEVVELLGDRVRIRTISMVNGLTTGAVSESGPSTRTTWANVNAFGKRYVRQAPFQGSEG